jgi:hypothetical protein
MDFRSQNQPIIEMDGCIVWIKCSKNIPALQYSPNDTLTAVIHAIESYVSLAAV